MEAHPQQPPPGAPSEEEIRAQIEEQLRTVRVQDVIIESAVSIVNLTARRIAKEDERDLEQGRVGIEAVRSLVELIDGQVAEQIRSALSELQLQYARATQGDDGGAAEPSEPAPKPAQEREEPPKPPPGLWVPGRGD